MDKSRKPTVFDLEDRTFIFASNIRQFVKKIPKTISNYEDSRQLIRSSGSIGANYIEANESLGKKDFLMKIKISKKEAKESLFWLNLIKVDLSNSLKIECEELIQEVIELMNILGSIYRKSI